MASRKRLHETSECLIRFFGVERNLTLRTHVSHHLEQYRDSEIHIQLLGKSTLRNGKQRSFLNANSRSRIGFVAAVFALRYDNYPMCLGLENGTIEHLREEPVAAIFKKIQLSVRADSNIHGLRHAASTTRPSRCCLMIVQIALSSCN